MTMNEQLKSIPTYDSSRFVWFNNVGRSTASELSSHNLLGFFVKDPHGKRKAFLLRQIEDIPSDLEWTIFESEDGEEIRVVRAVPPDASEKNRLNR